MKNIDYYIEQVKNSNIDGGIRRTKAYRFDEDNVILVNKYEEDFEILKDKIDKCKKLGANIPAYYEISDDKWYILEELAKGKEFAQVVENEEDSYKFIKNVPYEHLERFVKDNFIFDINGIGVETRRRNIFYDEEMGFTTIDVCSMEKSDVNDMDIYDVNSFFSIVAGPLPIITHQDENIQSKYILNILRAFENGHPLFKKYERWIIRNHEVLADCVTKEGIDLTLTDEEIKFFKENISKYIKSQVNPENINNLYYKQGVIESKMDIFKNSVKYSSNEALFGSNDIEFEKYIKNSVNNALEYYRKELFPSVYENREKCHKLFTQNSLEEISDEELNEINGGHILYFFEEVVDNYELIDQKIAPSELLNDFHTISLMYRKICQYEKESHDSFFDEYLNKFLDKIDADRLIASLSANVQPSSKTMGYVKLLPLVLINSVISIGIIILGIMLTK